MIGLAFIPVQLAARRPAAPPNALRNASGGYVRNASGGFVLKG